MRTLSLIGAAALVALAVAPNTGRAQDTTRQDTTRRVSPGEVATKATVASAAAAVRDAAANLARLQARSAVIASDIRLIDITTLTGDVAPFDSALAGNAEAATKLQEALVALPAVQGALASTTPALEPSAILAADVPATGTITVYYRRK
jgi:hypothetical protein